MNGFVFDINTIRIRNAWFELCHSATLANNYTNLTVHPDAISDAIFGVFVCPLLE
jgi:hypothetical protein